MSPPTLETALLSGEPVSIGLTEEQHEIIRALLESEKSVLILIAVAAYGQASSVQINLSTSAMIHY